MLASPGELRTERQLVLDVAEELNATWGEFVGLRLEVERWETHSWPGAGVDAQDVINRQIGGSSDVFVGIIAGRLGSATGRAESGTVEEFDRAYARWKADPSSVEVMLYFKEVADPEDGVALFRARVKELGVFYWKFKSTRQFEQAVRIHLSRQVQRLARTDPRMAVTGSPFQDLSAPSRAALALRIGEAGQRGAEAMDGFVRGAAAAGRCLEEFSADLRQSGERLLKLARPGFRQPKGGRYPILARLRDRMKGRAVELLTLNREAMSAYQEGLKQYTLLVATVAPTQAPGSLAREGVGGALTSIRRLGNQVAELRASQGELRQTVASGPVPAEVDGYMAARRAVLEALDAIDEDTSDSLRVTRELERLLEAQLEQYC